MSAGPGGPLAVAFFFGIPAAWLVERTNLPGKTIVFTLMTIGLLMPGFAAAMGWLFLMHPRIGLLNTLLIGALGLAEAPFDISSILGMGWVQGLNLAPLSFIMTAAVFRAMDPALEESAQMSGARASRVMGAITLPLAWPGILAAGIYIFTIGFAAFDVPAILGWGNRIFTFSTFLYLLTSPQDVLPQYGLAAALSGVIVVLAGLMGWWYARMQQRARRYAVITGKAYRPRMTDLGRWTWIAWGFLATYFVLSKLLAVILTTPRNMTLPVVIWTTWLGGGLGQSSALVVVMLALMIPLVVLYWFVTARYGLLSARGDA